MFMELVYKLQVFEKGRHSREGGNPFFQYLRDPPIKPEDDETCFYGQILLTRQLNTLILSFRLVRNLSLNSICYAV